MREIKFRAWALGKMGEPVTLEYIAGCMPRLNLSKCNSIMQYTGLKDKNGKEIYEGDLFTPDNGKHIYECIWDEIFVRFVGSGEKFGWYLNPNEASIVKIIGNIYENPELIDETK